LLTNVLVGVDGRTGGRDAIGLAKQLAAPDAPIRLAHVYSDAWMLGRAAPIVLTAGREFSEALLAGEREGAAIQAGLISWPSRSVGRGLHELAELHEADLLVVGSHARGVAGGLLPRNRTLAALNGAPCAVAIAPSGYAEHKGRLATVGVGHDGSPESEQALEAARELAGRHQAAISALAVVSLQSIPDGEQLPPHNWTAVTDRLIREERERLQDLDGVHGDAVYGEPSDELARFGEDLDLLIVGSRGYGPVGRLINGSTSTYLARHATCPLLVLPRQA
jgi:nucleotide-binding universal stress UspA family protein